MTELLRRGLPFIIIGSLVLVRCTGFNPHGYIGGGHDVEAKAFLCGMVVDSSGGGVGGVTVFAALSGYNPVTDTAQNIARCTTNEDGMFVAPICKDSAAWTLTAIDSVQERLFCRFGIVSRDTADTLNLGSDTLRKPASVVVQIPERFSGIDAVAYVPGTPLISDRLVPGEVNLSLPAGSITVICYDKAAQKSTIDGPNLVDIQTSSGMQLVLGAHEITVPKKPLGPQTGAIGQAITFTTGGSRSNYGHMVEYRLKWVGVPFNWNLATTGGWLSDSALTNSWDIGDHYKVRAEARSEIDTAVQSSWSSYFSIKISE